MRPGNGQLNTHRGLLPMRRGQIQGLNKPVTSQLVLLRQDVSATWPAASLKSYYFDQPDYRIVREGDVQARSEGLPPGSNMAAPLSYAVASLVGQTKTPFKSSR